MGSPGDVVEISSDEEDSPMAKNQPLEWVNEFFCGHDADDANGEDLFDLMVMGEMSAPPVPPQKNVKSGSCGGGEEDDDCMVLDGDPDKVVSVTEKGNAGDSSSDELQIVAEKGPVACRDFPHSRHLCSNLPFSTSSHVKHCSMCHCFVCDSPAPCNYWGKGTLINDHCHATDKEERWKTLRQAFKCKSVPASRLVKRQNDLYPTIPSSKQQDILSQVPVPQSHTPSRSNMSLPLANRNAILNVVNQNQQRHGSVRVSLNIERTVSLPRVSPATKGGRGTGNVHITHSHPRFKRVGTASQGHAIRNANQFGSTTSISALSLMHKAVPKVSQPYDAAARTNAFTSSVQNNAPQRSLSAPIASQGQQGQPLSPCHVASNGLYGVGPQLSRCPSLMTQRTQFLPEPVMDVSTQSWQDILASVACDLGVDDSDYSISTAQAQQPEIACSNPLQFSVNQVVSPHAESIVSPANLMTCTGGDLPSHSTGGDAQTNATQTTQTSHPLNFQSSLIPNEPHINNYVSPLGDGLLIEAAHQRESSGLDSADLVFDFELEDWDLAAP